MRAKHLGNLVSAQPLYRLHPLPKPNCLARIVASLGHHHQPNVVCLALLLAAHGEVEQQVLQIVAPNDIPQAKQSEAWQSTSEEEETAGREIADPGSGEALCSVGSRVVCDFVAQHRGESILAAAHVEDATVDKDFAAGDHKGVRSPWRV